MLATPWYFSCLVDADAKRLAKAFAPGAAAPPSIDDPLEGKVEGLDALEKFVAAKSKWLRDREALVEPVGRVEAAGREVSEVILHLELPEGRVMLPVAVAIDGEEGSVRAIRVYHSRWPLDREHKVRPPMLEADRNIVLGGAVAAYQSALKQGNLDAVLAAFAPNGVMREPSGGAYIYRGTAQLKKVYGAMFATGGVELEHCTATDDGRVCALEYNCTRWGSTELPRQAGLAVYVQGATGKLAAARIYDDVAPPPRA